MNTVLFIIWEERQAAKEQLYVLLHENHWVLKKLSLTELQQLVIGQKVCLILPAAECAIHHLHLPRVNAKDLPLAIASVLEDKILGDFADAFSYIDKISEHDYHVFLWDKLKLADSQAFFEKHQIALDIVTVDWFALEPREVFLMPDGGAYVYSDEVQGHLSKTVYNHWYQHYSFDALTTYAGVPHPDVLGLCEVPQGFWIWMAERLSAKPLKDIYAKPRRFEIDVFFDLKQLFNHLPRFLILSLSLILTVFMGCYLSNWFTIKKNQQKLQTVIAVNDDEIEFRLTRYLEKQSQKSQFWVLWTGLQSAKNPNVHIDNIQYQQRKIKLGLSVADMSSYQRFKQNLVRHGVIVINSQFQTDAKGIRVMLELQGGGHD
jgi:general secretion pathway protein L